MFCRYWSVISSSQTIVYCVCFVVILYWKWRCEFGLPPLIHNNHYWTTRFLRDLRLYLSELELRASNIFWLSYLFGSKLLIFSSLNIIWSNVGLSNEVLAQQAVHSSKYFLTISITKPDRTLCNNGNSKVSPDYIKLLKESVIQNDSLNTRERRDELNRKTGIALRKFRFAALLKYLNITRKKKTFLYEDASLSINQQRR